MLRLGMAFARSAPGPDPALAARIGRLRRDNQRAADADIRADIYLSRLHEDLGWSRWALYCIAAVLASFLAWAALATLDEVTTGSGRVIPSSREQVIQSLEAGVISEILVREGQSVEEGQPLLRIDDVRLGANVAESQSRLDALRLAATRLQAELRDAEPVFPAEIAARSPQLVRSERGTFAARRRALEAAVRAQSETLRLAEDELRITEPMAAKGLVSDLDVMRIKRTIVEARGRITELTGRHHSDAAAELARVEGELGVQGATLVGREDSLRRTVLRAPKRGVVKNIRVSTVGGVVQSGQDLLEIVPVDDSLLIETRIRPADIAFLRPGLPAIVKVSAYDSTVYGWLEGEVAQISADTIRDEVRRDESYYRVVVRTATAALRTPDGRALPIIPGMQAQIDIRTGRKSVLSYLLKPVMRAREAMRER